MDDNKDFLIRLGIIAGIFVDAICFNMIVSSYDSFAIGVAILFLFLATVGEIWCVAKLVNKGFWWKVYGASLIYTGIGIWIIGFDLIVFSFDFNFGLLLIGIFVLWIAYGSYKSNKKKYIESSRDEEKYDSLVKEEKERQDQALEERKRILQEEKAVEIEIEREYAEWSQSRDVPWEKKYYTSPCPYCGHYKVRRATWDDKRMSVAFWGAYSGKIGKNFKCDHCGEVFNYKKDVI